jgi:charged multivesicular body protein 7
LIDKGQSVADAVLQHQSSKPPNISESLYSRSSFKEEFAYVPFKGTELSQLDVDVLLKFLERDQQALLVQGDVSDGTLRLDKQLDHFI